MHDLQHPLVSASTFIIIQPLSVASGRSVLHEFGIVMDSLCARSKKTQTKLTVRLYIIDLCFFLSVASVAFCKRFGLFTKLDEHCVAELLPLC